MVKPYVETLKHIILAIIFPFTFEFIIDDRVIGIVKVEVELGELECVDPTKQFKALQCFMHW